MSDMFDTEEMLGSYNLTEDKAGNVIGDYNNQTKIKEKALMPWNPQVRSTKDFKDNNVGCLYGYSGSGKTTLLRSCDLILNSLGEDGLSSISDKNITVIDIDAKATPTEIITYLQTSEIGKKSARIGIDSGTWLVNKLFLNQVLGNRKSVSWADWDVVRSRFDTFITDLKSLRKEVWITSLAQIIRNDLSGEVMGCPDFATRNYSMEVEALFDHCIRVKDSVVNGKKQIIANLSSDGYFGAKIRTPKSVVLPTYTVDVTELTAHDLHKMLKGEK